MDSLERQHLVSFARSLIDIDSTTGREAEIGLWLAAHLRGRGFAVTEQSVEGDRLNILARLTEPPRVVFATHLDCVPPFFPSREQDGVLFGRGACDAKGILAAQVAAAERLRASGEHRVGLLFVCGEERGSDGARAANRVAPGSAFLVNGEPTDNRLGLATRGVWRVRFVATGRAAHSSHPELGESAIEKLVDAIAALRAIALPSDPLMGSTSYSVGLVSGGTAPNVIPARAEAEILFRTVSDAGGVRAALAPVEHLVGIEEVLEIPPIRLHSIPGFEAAVFPYATDIPLLTAWGRPMLFGPGSVLVAHTEGEHVSIEALCAGVAGYVALANALLGG